MNSQHLQNNIIKYYDRIVRNVVQQNIDSSILTTILINNQISSSCCVKVSFRLRCLITIETGSRF